MEKGRNTSRVSIRIDNHAYDCYEKVAAVKEITIGLLIKKLLEKNAESYMKKVINESSHQDKG